jgi:hypothetical protein
MTSFTQDEARAKIAAMTPEAREDFLARGTALYEAKQKRAEEEAMLAKTSNQQAPEKVVPLAPRATGPARVNMATPFVWRDPSLIPPRRWIYGSHYIREFLTLTVAPGGVGKSSLGIVEALAIATSKPLLGIAPNERTNVWYFNGEDPQSELERRVAAAGKHYGIDPAETNGRLFVDSGRSSAIRLAEMGPNGARIAQIVVNNVIHTIKTNNIGLLILDPFVATQSVSENDNPAIETVAALLAKIADETGCAIEVVHHARKTGGAEVTAEDSRGGSSLVNKARSVRTLNRMTPNEGEKFGVESPSFYFRVGGMNDKANLAPPAQARWHRTTGLELGNGDQVAVVVAWKPTGLFEGLSTSDLKAVQAKIAAGRWRESSQSKDWAGHAVAAVLKLDIVGRDAKAKANRARVASLLDVWIKNDALRVAEGKDSKSMPRSFIERGPGVPLNDG